MEPSHPRHKTNPLASLRPGISPPDPDASDGLPQVWSGRNPTATPPERALISLFDTCCVLLEKARPRKPGTEPSARSMLELFSLISSHPGFILDALVISKSCASHSQRRQALFMACSSFGATLMMIQKGGEIRKEVLAAARALPFGLEAVASYVSRTRGASAAELLQEAQSLGVPTYCCVPGIPAAHANTLRSSELPELAVQAVQLARALHSVNFKSSFEEVVSTGLISAASKSDAALTSALEFYEALGRFTAVLSRGFFTAKDLAENIQTLTRELPGISTPEDLAAAALAIVSPRLTAVRDEARQVAEQAATRKAFKLAASQDELEKEQEAVLVRQQKQEQETARKKQDALVLFHSAFQETPVPPESLAILERLESGNSIPHSHRPAAHRLFGIIDCLRSNLFDFRGDRPDALGDTNVQALASLIFSPANIGLAAQSFDIDASKCLQVSLPAKSPSEPNVRAVSDLFHSSPASRKTLMTMLDQADGILLLGTLLLPPSTISAYVKARDWESYGVDLKGLNIRQPLADRLRTVIEESIILKEARATLPRTEASRTTSKPVVVIPEWIEEVINRSEFVYSLEDGQILVALKEEPSAALYIPTKCLLDKSLFQRDFKLKLDELLSRLEIERMISDLKTTCGFEVERTNGSSGPTILLWHREYEIDAELAGLPKRWVGTLEALKQRFLQHEKSWELLLDRAERGRFAVDRSNESVVLRHPVLGVYPLSPSPYISIRKFDEVVQLIGQASVAEQRELTQTRRLKRIVELREKTIREQVLPLDGEDILVMDANVFINLAAKRDGGGTWLDLLDATANLSHVRVMVPAVVADFELLSRIVPFDRQDSHPLREGFRSRWSEPELAMKHFLDGASRIKVALKNDGTPTYVEGAPGANRKVCIVESPGDEDFYTRMHRLYIDAGENPYAFLERARMEVFGRGEGDRAISRFLRSCPFVNRIMVITSDMRYSNHEIPRTTGLGAPVSTCTVGAYAAAECSLRAEELAAHLNSESEIHFHIIAEDVRTHLLSLNRDPVYLFAESRLGVASQSSDLKPASIKEIIRRGLG